MNIKFNLHLASALLGGLSLSLIALTSAASSPNNPATAAGQDTAALGKTLAHDATARNALELLRKGRQAFRLDTLGSESFWGDRLRVHETIAGVANGGVGPGLSPAAALGVGLKVDAEALPEALRMDLRAGRVDLNDPATTVALLSLDSVIGLKGFFDEGQLSSVGVTCALCHSTVDDSFSPGIGRRLDGRPNRDLDVGRVIGLAQDLSPLTDALGLPEDTVRAVLDSWGPGRCLLHTSPSPRD